MSKSKALLALEEARSKITPWSQRPAWVAKVRAETERDRNEALRRAGKLPQAQSATPGQLTHWTTVIRETLAEHGTTEVPAKIKTLLTQYGAKACPACLEVLDRETGFHSGDSYCKPCAAKRGAEYREAHREAILQRQREAYARDPQKHRERVKQWAENNPEWINEYRNQYRQQRPLVKKLNNGYHRAVKAGNPAERISMEQLLEHWESVGIDQHRCYYTGEELTPETLSLDHGTPIGRGGGHVLDNLFPTTITTNEDKHTRTVAEYRELLQQELVNA